MQYKDVIPYLFFGVCTTLVNTATYWVCAHVFILNTMVSTTIAWILAVLFAYFTNRKWVFHSESKTLKMVLREVISFFGCRIATGAVDWICMFIFVQVFALKDVLVKLSTNILVIILNYIASRLIIFKKSSSGI
ncbi:GtrA family protein [Oribacterium sp. FC2011]|uniref:GtrA family protein n=1 Tax=Oribacterium sp. FC2011 TaxID=1408311 RepID=UPI0021007BFD